MAAIRDVPAVRGWEMQEPQIEDQEGRELMASLIVAGTPLVASLAEFVQHVYGEDYPKDGDTGLPLGLRLGIEKFKIGGHKHYLLIWAGRGQAALAAERQAEYASKMQAILNGEVLAAETGAKFDTGTR